MPMTVNPAELGTRVDAVLPALLEDLKDLVRIESVSADPARLGEVEKSAEKTLELFVAEGVDARIVRAFDGAPPAVIGEKKGPAFDTGSIHCQSEALGHVVDQHQRQLGRSVAPELCPGIGMEHADAQCAGGLPGPMTTPGRKITRGRPRSACMRCSSSSQAALERA